MPLAQAVVISPVEVMSCDRLVRLEFVAICLEGEQHPAWAGSALFPRTMEITNVEANLDCSWENKVT